MSLNVCCSYAGGPDRDASTAPPEDEDDDGGSLPVPAIVGGVIAGMVFIGVVFVIEIVLYNQKKKVRFKSKSEARETTARLLRGSQKQNTED